MLSSFLFICVKLQVAIRAREVDSAEDFCGGTITSRRTVVTTASCCSSRNKLLFKKKIEIAGETPFIKQS